MKNFIMNLTQKQKMIILIVVILVAGLGIFGLFKYLYSEEKISDGLQNSVDQNELEENVIEQFELKKDKGNILVHVIGEVKTPGVVRLNEGARIIDAINECGGYSENADLSKVNLAYILEDGVQIYIPRVGENLENRELMSGEAGEEVISESASYEANGRNIKVNINKANEEKLKTLPGVGESMAKKIIEYREKNGKFSNVEDIKKVNGIGESKYNNLKEFITIK